MCCVVTPATVFYVADLIGYGAGNNNGPSSSPPPKSTEERIISEKGREFEFNVGQIGERFCADKEPDNLPNWKAGVVSCLFSLFLSADL